MVLVIRHGVAAGVASPPPPTFSWPDATNTGSSGTLTTWTGSRTISVAGTVFANRIVTGGLHVTAPNVTVRNCRINFFDGYGVLGDGANLTVEDCHITGPGATGASLAAIAGQGTFQRNNISATENGITTGGTGTVIRRNFIHNLLDGDPDPHYDGCEFKDGNSGSIIEENTIQSYDTSCIFVVTDFGSTSNMTMNYNCLVSEPSTIGPAYPVYFIARFGYTITNVTVTNNHVQRGAYGVYFNIENCAPSFSGNVDYLTGANIDP